jgi:pectinesterase
MSDCGTGKNSEKVHVEADWVTFRGYGVNTTVVEWNDTASTIGANGKPLGTFGSATVAVDGDHFTARQISFKVKSPTTPLSFTSKSPK